MMTNAQLAAASFDDIVFDGRNKGYGAYELRGLYQRHVSRALVIATTIFALLVFFPVMANYLKDEAPIVPPVTVVVKPLIVQPDEVIIAPPPPPAAVKPVVQPPVARIRNAEFRVTRDVEATNKVPNASELLTKETGPKDVDGPAVAASSPDLPPVEAPATIGNEVASSAPYIWVEQMPELPGGGGTAAIVAAIQKAVRYPPAAIRNGVEGKVYVSFVVNAQGEVVDIKVVKGLGTGLDEETVRAINSLPRFIPGKQNGREVSVAFTVPITFKIQ